MAKSIKVGMADLRVCRAPEVVATVGLGSCVGLTMYDPITKIGGLVHYMLPDSKQMRNHGNIAKFADTGIEELLRQMLLAGANRRRLVAKIAGGAKMFQVSGTSNVGNIGDRNAMAAKVKLRELRIPLVAEDTGLDYGRTIELYCQTGDLCVRAIGRPAITI